MSCRHSVSLILVAVTLQQEQMVIEYVREHGSIQRSEAADLCRISGSQATRLLRRIAGKHPQFEQIGVRRRTRYIWKASPTWTYAHKY